MKLAEEPCHPRICKWEFWIRVIPAPLSSSPALKGNLKGWCLSFSGCEANQDTRLCLKQIVKIFPKTHHLPLSAQTFLYVSSFFCRRAINIKRLQWFGKLQSRWTPPCVNTLQRNDQYTAQAWLLSCFPQLYSVAAAFQQFQSESRQDFRDPPSAAKLPYCSGPDLLTIVVGHTKFTAVHPNLLLNSLLHHRLAHKVRSFQVEAQDTHLQLL